jgi:C-terminal processing protease CtpA/Prc
MTRTLYWTAITLALAAGAVGFENSVAAQEAADATAEADASAETESQASEASSSEESTTSETPSEQSESTATTQGSANGEIDTSSQSTGPSLPPPANQTEEQSDSAQGESQERSLIEHRQSTERDASATGRTSAEVDASAQGRSDVDLQRRGDAEMRARDDRSRDNRSGIRFRAGRDRSLTIDTIERNSVFYDSGLRRGDVVISIGNRPVRSDVEFVEYVTVHRGHRVPVVVLRDGRRETVYITYRDDVAAVERPHVYLEQVPAGSRPYFGVVFDGRVRDAAIVQSVHPDSPADHAGLQSGDEIIALNGERVYSYQDAIDMIRSTRPGEKIDIDFSRRLDNRTQAVIDSQPGGPMRTATNAPSVEAEAEIIPVPAYGDRSIETRRGDAGRDADVRDDEGADDRRLFNRGLLRRRN